jgi:hypothetical protein
MYLSFLIRLLGSMTCNGDFMITGSGNFGITGAVPITNCRNRLCNTVSLKGNLFMGNGSNITRTYGSSLPIWNSTEQLHNQLLPMAALIPAIPISTMLPASTMVSPIDLRLKGSVSFTSGLVNATSTNIPFHLVVQRYHYWWHPVPVL